MPGIGVQYRVWQCMLGHDVMLHALQRAKSGEGAFLDLYRQLYDAPDPAPCLATALVSRW